MIKSGSVLKLNVLCGLSLCLSRSAWQNGGFHFFFGGTFKNQIIFRWKWWIYFIFSSFLV